MSDEPTQEHDATDRAASAVAPAISPYNAAETPHRTAWRRRRKTRRVQKDQIDIVKVLLAPVKLLTGARSRQISAFEATLRAQVTKAIDGKDSASIKALIDLAIQYDLVAPPAPAARYCGIFVIPKALCEADQREIFTPGTPIGRIIEIILRHYDEQSE
jgi:hypothetical protein